MEQNIKQGKYCPWSRGFIDFRSFSRPTSAKNLNASDRNQIEEGLKDDNHSVHSPVETEPVRLSRLNRKDDQPPQIPRPHSNISFTSDKPKTNRKSNTNESPGQFKKVAIRINSFEKYSF